jgi:peptidoglycan hydrolase-like protein with peptidoglycan-binding domain
MKRTLSLVLAISTSLSPIILTAGAHADGRERARTTYTAPAVQPRSGPPPSAITDVPPAANAGECYARVVTPAVYDTVQERVVVEEGRQAVAVTDPGFVPGARDYVARDASEELSVRQPTFRTVTEQVLVRPAYERLAVVPAEYNTVTETIVVREPRQVWRRGANLSSIQRHDPITGEIYCLVTEPGETRTVTRRVLVRAEQVTRETVPAEYTTVTRQVMVDPGEVIRTPIAERRGSVATRELGAPATERAYNVPDRVGVVTRQVLRTPESFNWVQVLCDTNATPGAVRTIQSALQQRGLYRGSIDGIFGRGTLDAISSFQRAEGIPYQGYVTIETLERLGVGSVVQTAPAYRDGGSITPAPALMGGDEGNVRNVDGGSYYSAPPPPAVTYTPAPREAYVEPAPPPAERRNSRSSERRLTWAGKTTPNH